ncbi:retrovirus-related pol polyprotein from transposon TNT 1-94 [Tanacetum coccineum]
MSGAIPPIPPPFGASSGNPSSPNANRVDTIPTTTDPINTITTKNIVQSVIDVNLPQLLDSRGGSHVTNVPAFDKEDVTSLSTTENPLPKRQNQWSNAESRLANQDKRLKSIIISCLPNDVMKFVIKCKTAKEMWNDLILAHKGPSNTRDTKIAALRLKFNAFKSLEGKKDSDSDVEEDQRTSNEFMADLNAEYHERALLANQKRFYKRSGRVGSARKPIDKIKETCFACGKTGHFQKDCPSNKISTPSYPSSNNSFNKFKSYTPPINQTSSHNTGNYQKDYKGKYKGLKAKMVVLTQRIDDLTNGKSEKRKIDNGKSEKGLIAELFNWDEEFVSLEDEETTRIRAFMVIAEDEPSVGKANARFGQWVDITVKKNEVIRVNLENESLKDEISKLKRVIEKGKVTLDQLLFEQIPGNIVKALRGKGRRKENNPSKEVLFSKADVSTSESAPMITSDSEDDSDIQEPLPPLPKLTEADPSGASKSLISLSDLTANMADLTLNTASKKIKKSSNKVSQTYIIKKRTESKHLVVHNSCPDKNDLPSTEQLLLTLIEEVKGIKNQILIPLDTSSPVSQACSSKTPKQKDYLKRSVWYLDSGCSRHMTGVKQYLHRYSKEPGPKVVFEDDSSGDTEGYGSINCSVYKDSGTIFNQNDEVVLIALRRRDVYIIDMSFFNKESNTCFLANASLKVFYLKKKSDAADCIMSFIRNMENLNEIRVNELRSDNGTEFRNHKLEEFYDEKGIS